VNSGELKSAIYKGTIHHRRFKPAPHDFSYRMFMLYLDLGEIEHVFDDSRLFSSRKKAIAEFRRTDHLGDPEISLDMAVRDLVQQETGRRPDGPIRLLTHLRYFGYVFNPVSFYYCFDSEDQELQAIVTEVNNTPWGEQHCYVLPAKHSEASELQNRQGLLKFSPGKEMHVSPFMPMDIDYDWRFKAPAQRLGVHMTNYKEQEKIFDATLRLERKTLTASSLARSLGSFPFITLKVIVAIHWQAFRLWLKKVPFHPHPSLQIESASQIETNADLQEDRSR